MVILDTSVLIDLSRKKKYALELIASYQGKERVATTVITKYEMLRGAPKQYFNFITEFLERFVILDFSSEALNESVRIYRELKSKGTMINELDIIIAGIAAANDETLITKDTDFLNLESRKITVLQKR